MANIKLWKEEIEEVIELVNDIEENCDCITISKKELFNSITDTRDITVNLSIVADCMIKLLKKYRPQATNYEISLITETINSLDCDVYESLKTEIYLAVLNFGDIFEILLRHIDD